MKTTGLITALLALTLSGGALAGSNHQKAHWGYEGKSGPEHWGSLKKEYQTCSKGNRQSPINIHGGVPADLKKIRFNYDATTLKVLNNGHTIQVNYGAGSSISIGNESYDLLQFHFHSPSENHINGKSFPMEMHLVHKNSRGELAVVGIMLEKGAHHMELEKIWQHMPSKINREVRKAGVRIHASAFLPRDKSFHHFNGSLTTPPCSEGVKWYVMRNSIKLSDEQYEKFQTMIGNNARPIQDNNGRIILDRL